MQRLYDDDDSMIMIGHDSPVVQHQPSPTLQRRYCLHSLSTTLEFRWAAPHAPTPLIYVVGDLKHLLSRGPKRTLKEESHHHP
jgi:hypothetical protein